MTTQKQIEANRRNFRRSPGPKIRTGKAESKMNAMKHGLLAEQVAVRGEDPVEFPAWRRRTPWQVRAGIRRLDSRFAAP